MHIETERKFLVIDDSFKAEAIESHHMVQGYIAHDSGRTVRVRIADERGILTIKGPSHNGMSRLEWEMEIPLKDAQDLMMLSTGPVIDKTRYIVPARTSGDADSLAAGHKGRYFEVDEFYGDNEGLVMAELETASEDETFDRPSWLGDEVTGDRRFYNSYLSLHPFKSWK